MVRQKRSGSQVPVGGPETQFKRLRDQNVSEGMDQGTDFPPWYQPRWDTENMAGDHHSYNKGISESASGKLENTMEAIQGLRANITNLPASSQSSFYAMSTGSQVVPDVENPIVIGTMQQPSPTQFGGMVPPGRVHELSSTLHSGCFVTSPTQSIDVNPNSVISKPKPVSNRSRVTGSKGYIQVGNVDSLREYFSNRFGAILVNPCKPIAAKLVEALCPGKKQEFPYFNPNKPELYNGKPEWWPEGVEYRSPHHMRKRTLLSFLSYVLIMPLTNPVELQQILEEGPFQTWSELLDSTFVELNLRDSKHSAETSIRAYDDQRHYARLDVLKDVYKISNYAARCAEGEIDAGDLIPYSAVPHICRKESKTPSAQNSEDENEDVSENPRDSDPGEHGERTSRNQQSLAPTSHRALHHCKQPLNKGDDRRSSPAKTNRESKPSTPPGGTQVFVDAGREASQYERSQRQLHRGQDPFWHARLHDAFPVGSPNGFAIPMDHMKMKQASPAYQAPWSKPKGPIPEIQTGSTHDCDCRDSCSWPERCEAMRAYRKSVTQVCPSPHAYGFAASMPTCPTGFYMPYNPARPSISVPAQGSKNYSSMSDQPGNQSSTPAQLDPRHSQMTRSVVTPGARYDYFSWSNPEGGVVPPRTNGALGHEKKRP